MSKEMMTTLAAAAAILAFLWNISGEIRDIKGEIGELRGVAKANSQAITELREDTARDISQLRDDVRELRGVYASHLAAHAGQNSIAEAKA